VGLRWSSGKILAFLWLIVLLNLLTQCQTVWTCVGLASTQIRTDTCSFTFT